MRRYYLALRYVENQLSKWCKLRHNNGVLLSFRMKISAQEIRWRCRDGTADKSACCASLTT